MNNKQPGKKPNTCNYFSCVLCLRHLRTSRGIRKKARSAPSKQNELASKNKYKPANVTGEKNVKNVTIYKLTTKEMDEQTVTTQQNQKPQCILLHSGPLTHQILRYSEKKAS